MTKHIIVYSHGFGVRKDDRGLFTDIAKSLPEAEHIMFDYNEFDNSQNTLVARPLDQQVDMLLTQLKRLEADDVTIDIIAHSQGCIVTTLASPKNIRKTIFLAPPAQLLGLEKKEVYASRPDTMTDAEGTMYMPHRDGSTTIIKEDYWKSREGIKPLNLYNNFSKHTTITIVSATKDEVLPDTDYTGLSEKVKLVEIEANHDFTGQYRQQLLDHVSKEMKTSD